MRVLLVVHGFPPEEESGTELYVAELARALVRAGHTVGVFAGSHSARGPVREWRQDEGFEVERIARPRKRVRLNFADHSVESGFVSALGRFRPDVVHVHHLLGLTMPLVPLINAWGTPVVVTLHDHWFLCPEVQPFRPHAHPVHGERWGLNCFVHLELLRPLRAAAMVLRGDVLARARRHLARARVARAELEAADLVIAPSRFLASRFTELGWPGPMTYVLPHGIPRLDLPARTPAQAVTRVGYLGPILRDKGVDLLLRAFKGVRDPACRLDVRGPAPDPRFARRMRRLAARDPRVSLGTALPHEEVGAFLAGIDLLVVPSRFEESFSLVAHEAFAAGVPVVASDAGALPELVEPGANGALFRPGDRRDLRRRLRELLDDPAELGRLTHFPPVKTIDAHTHELAALYRALVAHVKLPQPLAR
ncbi:MAG TPA: glycosyltransferase [Gaiellaceae bacterium]|jgi:glycosyltransferase involved in cell wall biosynthesis|nr:glycosyltransferase [Gaiellaceae bacterium]